MEFLHRASAAVEAMPELPVVWSLLGQVVPQAGPGALSQFEIQVLEASLSAAHTPTEFSHKVSVVAAAMVVLPLALWGLEEMVQVPARVGR